MLGVTPNNLYGAAHVPRPPFLALEERDGVHTFLRTPEVTAVRGVHLVRLLPAPADDPRGPRALSPTPDWELWRGEWAEWLARLPPQCQQMTNQGPTPLSTAQHCPRQATDALGGSGMATPAAAHAYQDNSNVGL